MWDQSPMEPSLHITSVSTIAHGEKRWTGVSLLVRPQLCCQVFGILAWTFEGHVPPPWGSGHVPSQPCGRPRPVNSWRTWKRNVSASWLKLLPQRPRWVWKKWMDGSHVHCKLQFSVDININYCHLTFCKKVFNPAILLALTSECFNGLS